MKSLERALVISNVLIWVIFIICALLAIDEYESLDSRLIDVEDGGIVLITSNADCDN